MADDRTGPVIAGIKRRLKAVEDRPSPVDAVSAEAKLRSDADAAEAKARSDADIAEAARQVKLSGTLTLPAGLGILAGKTLRTATVTGLKAGDDINVTPKAALPTGIAMAEAYCLVDGVLTVALTAVGLITIAAKTDIPLGVVALR